MAHFSDVMVIRCADDNYGSTRPYAAGFSRIIIGEQASDCFLLTNFGASLEFSQPVYLPGWLKTIETARALRIKRVLIVDHLDCGAFALEYGAMDQETEKTKHLECLKTAQEWFKTNAPDFKFTAYLQDRNQSEKNI